MTRILTALVFLLAAGSASAADGWFANKDCTRSMTGSEVGLANRQTMYFCVTSSATLNAFSPVLATNGYVLWITRIGDINQLLSGSGEVKVFETASAAGSSISASTGLDQRGADVDGDGIEDTLSLNGAVSRGAINGFTAVGITLQITALPAATEQMVIAVTGIK